MKVAPKFFKVPEERESNLSRSSPLKLTLTIPRTSAAMDPKDEELPIVPLGSQSQRRHDHSAKRRDQAVSLALAPEEYYDVVMRADLDGDLRDFNGKGIECRVQPQHLHADGLKHRVFRLKLHPAGAKFTPNVQHNDNFPDAQWTPEADALQKVIWIKDVPCPYSVFQHRGDIVTKRWVIDVPGFSPVNNLDLGKVLKMKERDVRMAAGMGVPRVEFHAENLARKEVDECWTEVTSTEQPPVHKQDKVLTFEVGFPFDRRKIGVSQQSGQLVIEVKSQDESSDDD